jgi:hypothetical protein
LPSLFSFLYLLCFVDLLSSSSSEFVETKRTHFRDKMYVIQAINRQRNRHRIYTYESLLTVASDTVWLDSKSLHLHNSFFPLFQ